MSEEQADIIASQDFKDISQEMNLSYNENDKINFDNNLPGKLIEVQNEVPLNKSLHLDFRDDFKEKPYSEFHSYIDRLDNKINNQEEEIIEKNNNSMFEKPKINLVRPPVPEFNNLCKKADKHFLKKIQNILKKSNNTNKSFNYLSSDEEK